MGDDGARRKLGSKSAHDRLTRQTVKPVALNAILEEFAAKWQACGNVWHGPMKGGIETGDMRDVRKNFHGAPQYVECRRQMEWSKWDRFVELSDYLRRDSLMRA